MLTTAQLEELRAVSGSANRVRAAMQLAGLTQVQLASKTGLAQPQISQIVNDAYSKLPLDYAQRLAQALGCQIEDLFPARESVA